jgi:2-alkenal reductase
MPTKTNQSKSFLAIAGGLTLAIILTVVLLTSGGLSGLTQVNAQTGTGTSDGNTPALISTSAVDTSAAMTEMVNEQELLANLYQSVLPSVVNIQVTLAPQVSMNGIPQNFPFSVPSPDTTPQQGEGSGWVFDNQGHIVTNNHVIENATEITVVFYNGEWANATVVAADPQADLAVLKVDMPAGVDAKPLTLAAPDSMRVGYSVIAIGSPFGNDRTMTTGIVSALGRSFPVGDGTSTTNYTIPDVIQTDAAINPGNSGGPLFNLNGEVVGVNFAINSPVRASSGIGFAIPVAIVQRVVPALIKDGAYAYPFLGISGQSITPAVAKDQNLPNNVQGALVGDVMSDGPSANSGLTSGDIITGMDGTPIHSFDDLVAFLITQTTPGQKVEATVLRGDKEMKIAITLGERPTTSATQASQPNFQPGQPNARPAVITIDKAITTAQQAVEATGMSDITSSNAKSDQVGGQPVWVVTLQSSSKTATVTVDAHTGDVLELSIKSN